MSTQPIFLISFILLAIAIIVVSIRFHFNNKIELTDWLILSLGFVYGPGHAAVIQSFQTGNNVYWADKVSNLHDMWAAPVFGIVAILGIWLGHIIMGSLQVSASPVKFPTVNSIHRMRIAWLFLGIAIVAFWLYSMAYGGFRGLITHNAAIRAGFTGMNNPWSFLNRFGGLSFFAAFMFFSIWLDRIRSANIVIGLISSLFFSLFVFLVWLGRIQLLIFLAAFPLSYALHRYGKGRRLVLSVGAIILLGVVLINPITTLLAPGKSRDSALGLLVAEISFPAASTLGAIDSYGDQRHGRDIIFAPVFLLPQKLWSQKWGLDTASDQNTTRLLGGSKGSIVGGERVSGGIPTDFITFGLMQFGVTGVAALGILWGAMLRYLEDLLTSVKAAGLKASLNAYAILSLALLSSLYADPHHILTRNFHYIVGCTVLYLVGRMSRSSMEAG